MVTPNRRTRQLPDPSREGQVRVHDEGRVLLLTSQEVKGLLGSVATHLASLSRARFHVAFDAIRDATTPEALANVLHDTGVGLAPPAHEAFIVELCFSDEWLEMRDRLVRSMEQARADHMWPGA